MWTWKKYETKKKKFSSLPDKLFLISNELFKYDIILCSIENKVHFYVWRKILYFWERTKTFYWNIFITFIIIHTYKWLITETKCFASVQKMITRQEMIYFTFTGRQIARKVPTTTIINSSRGKRSHQIKIHGICINLQTT